MGEVIKFISRAERERIRLIREARANYDSVFPPSGALNEQRDKAPVSGGDGRRADGIRP